MKDSESSSHAGATPPGAPPVVTPDDEAPGVPGFRTWRGVYVFVFTMFVLIVVALAIFTRVYA